MDVRVDEAWQHRLASGIDDPVGGKAVRLEPRWRAGIDQAIILERHHAVRNNHIPPGHGHDVSAFDHGLGQGHPQAACARDKGTLAFGVTLVQRDGVRAHTAAPHILSSRT